MIREIWGNYIETKFRLSKVDSVERNDIIIES